mmetsp:Transcript_31417/g.72209  ORF Transcript_31417/g.72209 Transcript_31417/m.72209 type:complete len:542 (+) Transcript_31417:37-1662(+)
MAAITHALVWLAWLTTAGSAGPAVVVVVGELFRDLLTVPRMDGGRTCLRDTSRSRKKRANAPWLRQSYPTLRELRETMLSEASVFNASLRHCLPHGLGPPNLCVQGTRKRPRLFDQFSLEVVLLTRWLQEAPICRPDEGSCGAHMVIVPSLIFHHTVAVGRSWSWKYCMTAPLAAEYWRRVAFRYFTPGTAGPLIVVPESYAWFSQSSFILLRALSLMPAEFRARVCILTTMSNQQQAFRRLAGFGQPWQSGAEAELQRRVRLQQERARLSALGTLDARTALALLPTAPLMITVPTPVGVFQHDLRWDLSWASSADYNPRLRTISLLWSADLSRNGEEHTLLVTKASNVRNRLSSALARANAICSGDRSRCVKCAPHAPLCASVPKSTFKDTARSALCIEPPGDTLGRSHAFVALLTGCIPVLVEGGHPAYPEEEPTWWPWRAAPGIPATESPLRGLTLDYSAFSLLSDGGGSKDSEAAIRLVNESAFLAADEQRLSRMRAELARVAPLFVYARQRPPAGAPEDAFERLRETLARVLLVRV